MKKTGQNSSHNDKLFGHHQGNLKTRAIRGAGVTIAAQTSISAIDMIGTFILARMITPEDFGLVSMVISIYWLLMTFRNLGLIDTTIQMKEINHKQISTLFWITAGFGVMLMLIFIGIAPLIAWFYHKPQLKQIAIALAFVFFFEGFSTQHQSLLKRNMQFTRYAVTDISATIIGVIVSLVTALYGWGYWSLIIKRLVVALTTTIGVWLLCRWRPGLPGIGTGAGEMLKFGGKIIGNSFFDYFSKYLDKILIGRYIGAQALGFYDRAYVLFMAPSQQMSVPLTHVAISALSRLRDNHDKYLSHYLKALSLLALVGMLTSVLLIVLSEDIILLLLGDRWGKTGELFSIFGVGIGTQMVYATNAWLHISLGRTDRLIRWGFIAFLMNTVAFAVGLQFGTKGVAIAYIAALYTITLPALWYAGKPIRLGISTIIETVWKYYLSAAGAGILSWLALHPEGSGPGLLSGLNIFFRLSAGTAMITVLYLLFIIIVHQNMQPFRNILSLLNNLKPGLDNSEP